MMRQVKPKPPLLQIEVRGFKFPLIPIARANARISRLEAAIKEAKGDPAKIVWPAQCASIT